MRFLYILILISSFNALSSDISCSELNMGSFLISEGLTSVTDQGFNRLWDNSLVGNRSKCVINCNGSNQFYIEFSKNNLLSNISSKKKIKIKIKMYDIFNNKLNENQLLTCNENKYILFIDASSEKAKIDLNNNKSFTGVIPISIHYLQNNQ